MHKNELDSHLKPPWKKIEMFFPPNMYSVAPGRMQVFTDESIKPCVLDETTRLKRDCSDFSAGWLPTSAPQGTRVTGVLGSL